MAEGVTNDSFIVDGRFIVHSVSIKTFVISSHNDCITFKSECMLGA